MKKITRILALALTFMLLVTGMVSTFGVSAAGRYECDITIDNIKAGQFEYMAYDIANQKFFELEAASKPTWSPDWPGHFVPGKEIYTVSKSERAEGLVDMMCNKNENWGSAVVFTAPADGKYNIVAMLEKLYGKDSDSNGLVCYVDIMLVKGSDGSVIFKEEKLERGKVEWAKRNIELTANEKVYILVLPNDESTKTSSQNVALLTFLVTEAVEQTPPQQTTNPNQTTVPDNTGSQETTGPEVNNGAQETSPERVNPVIIVAIVGGVLVLASVITVIILRAKKKK